MLSSGGFFFFGVDEEIQYDATGGGGEECTMYKVFIYDTTPCVLMVRLCRIRDRSRFAAATSPRFEMQEEAISKAGIN